jgi:hypothetical protein
VAGLKECGFRYVALDLEGYRTGSMNEVLAGALADSRGNGAAACACPPGTARRE